MTHRGVWHYEVDEPHTKALIPVKDECGNFITSFPCVEEAAFYVRAHNEHLDGHQHGWRYA